jgi:hypothetical protein
VLQAFAGVTVEDYEAQAEAFLHSAQHPTLGRAYLACSYAPMVELLGYIVRKPEADVLDDGPAKPVRIWSRVGRRPLLAAGNSNGDIPMLAFAEQPGRPGLRLLVLHDDPEREFDYTSGAEQALEQARGNGWTVVSVNDDWAAVF